MTRERFRNRCVVFVAVIALHGSFLLVLWTREPILRAGAPREPSSTLFFVDPPRPTATVAAPDRSPRVELPSTEYPLSSTPEETLTEPAKSSPPAPIDWTAQATEAAAAVVEKAISEETRKCDPSDAPTSFLPPCNPKTKKFQWNPEPGRFGFSGGLPYVRVGERCAIGLGFFGCGFGAKPPANGDLFEGMDDPERDRSSVPSSDP